MQNVFKYCPNCKSGNTSFTNNHRFECNDCDFVYYHNVATAVAIIIQKDDKILFTRRNNDPMRGTLDLPGGFVDPDESAETACRRELFEELGLKSIKNLHYFSSEPNTYMFRGIQYRTCDIIYVTDLEDDELIVDAGEIQQIQWIPKNEVDLNEVGFYSIKRVLSRYLNIPLDL